MRRIILACAIAGVLGVSAFGQGVDPLVGTWKLNLEKSKCTCQYPKSQIMTFTGEGQNFTNTVERVELQGKLVKYVLSHVYDGQPHPVTGNPDYDSTTFTRVGNTINAVRFKNGKVVGVAQGVVDPGKTYTFTQEGIDANNQHWSEVAVFDRQ